VKRTGKILRVFRDHYAEARDALNLATAEISKSIGLAGRPSKSGSDGPRLVLAYYSAIWQVCATQSSVPIVIDSLNQQDQDEVNLPAVIKFIADKVPPSMQLIVCLTKHPDAHFNKIIHLQDQYRLLTDSQFQQVDSEIGSCYGRMNEALLTM
jgi:hypothetical protein